jgi:hypothetical protein
VRSWADALDGDHGNGELQACIISACGRAGLWVDGGAPEGPEALPGELSRRVDRAMAIVRRCVDLRLSTACNYGAASAWCNALQRTGSGAISEVHRPQAA